MIASKSQSQATLPEERSCHIASRKIGDSVHYRSQRLLASLVGFGPSSEMPNFSITGFFPGGNFNSADRALHVKLMPNSSTSRLPRSAWIIAVLEGYFRGQAGRKR